MQMVSHGACHHDESTNLISNDYAFMMGGTLSEGRAVGAFAAEALEVCCPG